MITLRLIIKQYQYDRIIEKNISKIIIKHFIYEKQNYLVPITIYKLPYNDFFISYINLTIIVICYGLFDFSPRLL